MSSKITDLNSSLFNTELSINSNILSLPEEILSKIFSYIFNKIIEEAKSVEESSLDNVRLRVKEMNTSGTEILPSSPVNNSLDARLINKYTDKFFKSPYVDVREVLPGIQRYGTKTAREVYRDFKPVIDIIGGLEYFKKLPEITWDKNIQAMQMSDLTASVVKVKSETCLPWVAFRTISTYLCPTYRLGHIKKKKIEYGQYGREHCGWYITFGLGYPEIKMNRKLGTWDLEPANEDKITQAIKNPMQTLNKLFRSPVYSEGSNVEGIEVIIENETYNMALTDAYH
jgi:hypothetical protein